MSHSIEYFIGFYIESGMTTYNEISIFSIKYRLMFRISRNVNKFPSKYGLDLERWWYNLANSFAKWCFGVCFALLNREIAKKSSIFVAKGKIWMNIGYSNHYVAQNSPFSLKIVPLIVVVEK